MSFAEHFKYISKERVKLHFGLDEEFETHFGFLLPFTKNLIKRTLNILLADKLNTFLREKKDEIAKSKKNLPLRFESFAELESYAKQDKENLLLAIVNFLNSIKEHIENKEDEEKQKFANYLEQMIIANCNLRYQFIGDYLPSFIFSSIITFDNLYPIFTKEGKNELQNECKLDTPKKRMQAFSAFLEILFSEKITKGGSESEWNELLLLQFLASYERYRMVLKRARADVEEIRKDAEKKRKEKKISKEEKLTLITENLEVIREKYEIPEDTFNYISKEAKPRGLENIALYHAIEKMKRILSKEKLSKLFNEKHLRKRTLKGALKDRDILKDRHLKIRVLERAKQIAEEQIEEFLRKNSELKALEEIIKEGTEFNRVEDSEEEKQNAKVEYGKPFILLDQTNLTFKDEQTSPLPFIFNRETETFVTLS